MYSDSQHQVGQVDSNVSEVEVLTCECSLFLSLLWNENVCLAKNEISMLSLNVSLYLTHVSSYQLWCNDT